MEQIKYQPGDIVRMKKKHPCGSDNWLITRTGIDFGMRCQGCGHFILLPRTKFERMARGIVNRENKE